MSRHPEVLWAQRSDKVYLTVALPDAKNISVRCEPQGLFGFSALGVQGEPFDFSLALYGPIVPEHSQDLCLFRVVETTLGDGRKPAPYLKVDWNKWCDEDEEESTSDLVSDDDDDDVDDDQEEGSSGDEGMLYLPDLEKARGN
ncbi:hypothetical protein FNV43_RR01201 [Rhamnella rubrinervis]|uniref:Co-chaperone protein p23 n=1 Tax=Rhamnella rubrinervis TaxID=2594499 RepID=A0A8K0MSQ9_9ROSA|nr:hypothetical protein FNV43_RR01201 [Rhamnella rubrinervis]